MNTQQLTIALLQYMPNTPAFDNERRRVSALVGLAGL
jgi:hypothetical protein